MKTHSKGIRRLLLILGVSILFFPFQTKAQHNWSLNFRPAANFASNYLGDATLKNGFGAEATIGFQIFPQIAAYAGWGWNQFSTDNLYEYSHVDVQENGYKAGLTFTQPLGNSKINYLLGAGAIYKHLEIEDSEGTILNDSKYGLGFEAETGFVFLLGEKFNLSPTIRYQELNLEFKKTISAPTVALNYVSAGIRLSFLL